MALIANNISGSINNSSRIGITGSVIFANRPGSSFPVLPTDTIFYVSGSKGAVDKAVFHGDVILSGTTYIGTAEAGGSLEVTGLGGIIMNPYGTGAGQTSEIRFKELVANGGSYVAIKAPNSLAASLSFVLPTADGSANHVIKTDGAGNLSFAAATTLVTPGGSTTEVQFRDGGAFGGDAEFTYDKTANTLTVGNIAAQTTTFNLANSAATTINFGGAATAVEIGSATGTTSVNNSLTVDGNTTLGNASTDTTTVAGSLAVNGTAASSTNKITSTQTTFNLLNDTVTTLNIGGAATAIDVGAATGTTSVNNSLTVDGKLTVTGGTTTVTDAVLGNAAVGSFPFYDGGASSGVYAMFGHKDLDNSTAITNYAIYQDNTGNTSINASNDKTLFLSVNNTAMGFLTNNLLGTGIDAISITGESSTKTNMALGNTTGDSSTTIYAGTGGMLLTGTIGTSYTIGGQGTTAAITVGRSIDDNTVNIATGTTAAGKIQTVNIATSATSTGFSRVNIGNSNSSTAVTVTGGSSITLTGADATTYTVGTATTSGGITVGQSTATSNTIAIGSSITNGSAGTQTINIGTGTGRNVITVGSIGANNGALGSSLSLIAGIGHMTFTGATTTNYTMGTTTGTGTITIGQSTAANTVDIASGASTSTQTVNIANNTGTAGTSLISIASSSLGTKKVYIGRNGGSGYFFGSGIGSEVYVHGNIIRIGDNTGGWPAAITLSGSITCTGISTTDSDLFAGSAELGSFPAWTPDPSAFAMFGHKTLSHSSIGNYALLQSSVGSTAVNAASGQTLYFRNNNVDLASLTSGITSLTGGTGVATTTTLGNTTTTSTTSIYAGSGGIILSGSGGSTVITGSSSTRTDAIIGAWEIGSLPATQTSFPNVYAFAGHKDLDHSADGNYALVQSNVGDTFLGAVSTKDIFFKNGTDIVGQLSNDTVSFTGKTTTATTTTLGNSSGASATNISAGSGGIFVTGSTTISATTFNYPTGSSTTCPIVIRTDIGANIHRWALGMDTSADLNFSYGLNTTTVLSKGYLNDATNVAAIDFTGQHRSYPVSGMIDQFINSVGMIVVSSGQYKNLISGSSEIFINEALPLVELSSTRNQKSVFGVVSECEDPNENSRWYEVGNWGSVYEKRQNDDRLIINSLGEGAIWVCNINGNLENGDYITTCEIPGYGMKQDDDLLHNYTVAKITMNCDFTLNNGLYRCEEFNYEGTIYRKAFVGCTYHCG